MADITVNKTKVKPQGNAHVRRRTLGGAASAGHGVYHSSTGSIKSDATNLAKSQVRGVVISNRTGQADFVSGERVDVVTYGPVEGYSGMTPGAAVYGSEENAGGLTHTKPATSGSYPFVVGYAESATCLFVDPQVIVPTVVT